MLNRRRRLLFICLCLLSPVFLFVVVEGILRCFGLGGYPAVMRAVGSMSDRTLYVTETKAASSFFYANRSRPGSMYESDFLVPKPAGALRVLVCGESAAKGFPEPRALAWTSFLEEMLRDLLPGRQVEVINTATTAVASFPILCMLQESLLCRPDVVVIYCGNNEFFGAYGVTSLHSAGRTPRGMQFQRAFRSTAIAQVLERFAQVGSPGDGRTLMESVVAKAHLGRDDSLRRDAAANLRANVSEMITACQSAGVPVIVCTPPCNERDMAPLGSDDLSGLAADRKATVEKLCASARLRLAADPGGLLSELESLSKEFPDHALLHFLRGKALCSMGRTREAQSEFQAAIDLDPMPWRPPAANVEAVRSAARQANAALCDLVQAFRDASPGGSIGSNLMDDHVHPSLRGQELVARAVVGAMSELPGLLAIPPGAIAKLPSADVYARRLGDNAYERYGVAHTMRVLCGVPFIRSTNPDVFDRLDKQCKEFEATLSPALLEVVRRWQDPKTHTGNIQRPLSAMVGRVMLSKEQNEEAARLYATAVRSVPSYSSLSLEYTYFRLAALERIKKRLEEADKLEARDAIDRGTFLLAHGFAGTGMTERYIGRLHQLRGEFAEAVPFLAIARDRLTGMDQVAADQAMVVSYIRTGQRDKAFTLVQQRLGQGGPFTRLYQQMLGGISTASAPAANPPTVP